MHLPHRHHDPLAEQLAQRLADSRGENRLLVAEIIRLRTENQHLEEELVHEWTEKGER